jgi:hypothetical protein
MPVPNFKDTLGGALAPGITIVSSGNYFDIDDTPEHIDIGVMNKELATSAKSDEIVFMHSDPPKEDLSLKFFLESKDSSK